MNREASTSDVLERVLLDESAEPTQLPLSLLEGITNRFSPDHQIGIGGFAVVYKGLVGKGMVAVKKFSNTFGVHEKNFQEEVKCMIKAKHKNIVRFLGYCADTQGKMEIYEGEFVMAEQRNWLLCFEYACNGSLNEHITDSSCGLDWRERYQVIRGICEGLHFLHEQRILHLDLKPANILLDGQMVPKICDFGISRCLGEEQTRAITKSRFGTLGYMDPEHLRSGQITFASDIYSLGVIILEILTGVKWYVEEEKVVENWVNRLDASERDLQLEQVRVCTKIGIECMNLDPKKRPVARHIINRLDKTASADYSHESGTSSSLVQLHASLPRRQSGERFGKLASESLHKADVEENCKKLEDSLWGAWLSLGRLIPEHVPESGSSSGLVKLRFVDADRPKDPIYTGSPVDWQNGQNAKVAIFRDGKQIKGGDLSKLQIEILVHADFFIERGLEDFTKQELSKQIYRYNGKESALTTVNLKNGEANIGSIIFTESSYRKKLRLTARVKRQDLAVRVQEAISEPFIVKVGRSKASEKSYPPMKEEPIHCLETISPKGKHCRYLANNNITTVKHLMRHYHIDKSGLQKLTGMKKDDWSTLIKHATTSDPGFEIYSYRVVEENTELLFNDFYDIVGMMINGFYVPVNDFDHFQQHKANNWKMPAYRSFDERESSGGLTPDYFVSNGRPGREEPLNNDAGPSTQARTACQYPNDITAQHVFGERHAFQHQNGFSPAEVLSNDDAFPSQQEVPLFSQRTAQQDLGQHGPSMPQNGTLYCHQNQGNILNGLGALSAQLTVPSNNFPSVQEGDLMTGACVTAQRSIYLGSSTAEAPATSFAVADGVSQQTTSLNGVQADNLSWSPQFEDWFGSDAHVADQSFV